MCYSGVNWPGSMGDLEVADVVSITALLQFNVVLVTNVVLLVRVFVEHDPKTNRIFNTEEANRFSFFLI
jgi:hypothetical protein